MKIWIYRVLLLNFLFGVNSLTYGANQDSPLLTAAINLTGLICAVSLMLFYFKYPASYKALAWIITLGVIGLVLESLHLYNQYVYSFFVIKRFAYCGAALLTFIIASRAGKLKLEWAVWIILALFTVPLFIEGRLFSYGFSSETRPTSAYETFYLVIPFLFYLVRYMTERRRLDLFWTLAVLSIIVLLLHRSVISTAVFSALIVVMLSAIGKLANSTLQIGRTTSTMVILAVIIFPFIGALSPAKTEAFIENIGGIFSPAEDETGSWRLEQSRYYWKGILERPVLGWRYEGYDRGEIMENEDFPEKGTVIHSQYVDMLYNYGAVGLGINLLLVAVTLLFMYTRSRKFTADQTVLFGFIVGGLLFGVSYQLPIYYWSFTGLGMLSALYNPGQPPVSYIPTELMQPGYGVPYQATLINSPNQHD